MPIYAFDGIRPVVHPTAYVHPTAVLIGDVIIGAHVYIGPCASLRGDMGRIVIGDGSNIQDNVVAHGFPGTDTTVEEDGHIGHAAVLHGCTLRRNVMIGMGAVIMDFATIGESAIIGAASFVATRQEIPPRTLALGVPARVKRDLSEDELAWKIAGTAAYRTLCQQSHTLLEVCEPLPEMEQGRRRVDQKPAVPLSIMNKQSPRS